MSIEAHKGQILPLANQLIPISQNTTFHASYDNDLNGFNQGQKVSPMGYQKSLRYQTNTIVRIPHSSSYPTTGITVEFWMRPNQLIVSELITKYNAANTALTGFELYQNNDKISFHLINGVVLTSAVALAVGVWVHVACTWDGSTLRAYINGIQDPTTAAIASMPVATGDLVFGRYIDGRYQYDGNMNDVRIWNYARTAQQIKDNMNLELRGDESGLYGYWKLSEGANTVSNDSSVSSNDGMITNGVWEAGRTIATLRPNGKFGGAVAVEESTTNIVPDPLTMPASTWTARENVTVTYNERDPFGGFNAARIHPNTTTDNYFGTRETMVAGTYTASVWLKSSVENKSVNIYIGNNEVVKTVTLTTKWQLFSSTGSPTVTGAKLHIGGWGSWIDTSFDIWIAYPQVEQKSFATSFVNGSRSAGILKYPASVINPAQGTVSLWYNPAFPAALNTSQGVSPIMFQAGNYYSNSSFTIWNYQKNFNVYFKGPTSSGWSGMASVLTGNAFPENVWGMVTVTWNGTLWKLYKDGVYQGNFTATEAMGAIAGDVIGIGSLIDTSNPSNGLIDDVRIERLAVSDDEILAWYQSNSPFYNYLDYTGVGY